jgi:molecular chaperone DnaK
MMATMIDFGIDLGTSNSLIAKFDSGKIEVFKNPRGHKESLPSVVAFRKDKILIGEKARDYINKDSKNVASRFKRKMGTTETVRIESIDASKTPEELSSFILKELKEFVHSGEAVTRAVITIPASFDTIQSNATKDAGVKAGIEEVVLLQEPIAASLAYANKDNSDDLKNSQWIVYDLGGGTFDVALVKIVEGELTVVDHEGNNYFGGTDLDSLIVEKLLVPVLESSGNFSDLIGEMKSASGRYEKQWYRFLIAAEEAKIELSSDLSTEIEYDLDDDDGKSISGVVTITRSQFEDLIRDRISETITMLKTILTRQSLQPSDLKFVLMVGGSTFIPFVRKHVEEVMGITVNTDIDPTNAIVTGAAFFAGSRQAQLNTPNTEDDSHRQSIKVRAIYERSSQEAEEMFSAKIDGAIEGMTYRIHSVDGSFDSGVKELSSRIHEDLPLREGEYNMFELRIVDSAGNVIDHPHEQIQIAHGQYSVAGQMLPDELCLVKDTIGEGDTMLTRLFDKNCILPTRAKSTVEVGRTVVKGAAENDNRIKIMVVEGASDGHYLSNKLIGTLEITGEMISKDLLKGTEIDLTFELSESRDLSISAYLNATGQDFSQVFNPKKRDVKASDLCDDIFKLENMVLIEQEEAAANDSNGTDNALGSVLGQVQALISDTKNLSEDSVTDEKFQLDDKKRKLAAELYQLTSSKRIDAARAAYQEMKDEVSVTVRDFGNDNEKHRVREVISREEVFLHSNNVESVENSTAELAAVRYQIMMRSPRFLIGMFEHLVESRVSMNDQVQAKNIIENGRHLIEAESWEDLKNVISRLWDLMPETEQDTEEARMFTGIV